MKQTRAYVMRSRAASVEQTRERVLDATIALYFERPASAIALEDIAARAGVSVQTVLRHFGGRAALVEAAFEHGAAAVREERRAPSGDAGAAVRAIVEHYERRGEGVLLQLAQERSEELSRRFVELAREMHRAWVEEQFAVFLAEAADPQSLRDQLVVVTDVYTWKVLRLDRGLSRRKTQERIEALVTAVLAAGVRPQAGG